MEKSLYQELKRIGIDDELAHQVSASLDPDYNASKKDVLVMQEAIMQVQLQSERSYQSLRSDIVDVRSEMHSINRQFIFAFGGMVVTILSVLAINIYFH